jgi:TonB family protein
VAATLEKRLVRRQFQPQNAFSCGGNGMSAATATAFAKKPRAFPRYSIKVPLDVIALRSGVPENLPGRCSDLSEGGVGAMVAGELSPGQHVALELRLPNVGLPVRTRAVVRYQGATRSGFEFIGLAPEHREMIRFWAHRLATQSPKKKSSAQAEAASTAKQEVVSPKAQEDWIRRRRVHLVVMGTLILLAASWLHWQRLWGDLEQETVEQSAPLQIPADKMTERIVSRVAPIYPEEARRAGTQGLVVLDAVIAADGSVKRVQPLAGDEVLVKSASEAVRQWRFEPYQSFSRAHEVETTIAVEFRLN